MNESLMEKKILDGSDVEKILSAGMYAVEGEPLACCVDGRDHDKNAAAAPGADAGKMIEAIAALRDLGLPIDGSLREKVMDAVVASIGGKDKFRFHTDTHAQGTGRGCGHLRLASENSSDFHLASDDMAAVFDRLETMKGGEVVLEGDHAEGAVIVMTDKAKGVIHETEGKQAFVYHAAWDEARLGRLAEVLAGIPEVQSAGLDALKISQMLLSIASLQRNFTLNKLAKGLPIYEAGDKVSAVGTV